MIPFGRMILGGQQRMLLIQEAEIGARSVSGAVVKLSDI
jgi:hypothetical protein